MCMQPDAYVSVYLSHRGWCCVVTSGRVRIDHVMMAGTGHCHTAHYGNSYCRLIDHLSGYRCGI